MPGYHNMIESFPWPLLSTVLATTLAYIVFGAIQRLYFHPLSKIPGPKLAALTHWYEFYYDVIQPGQYVFKIKELHKEYGPVVRINPREVHINDVDFLEEIYPSSNSRKRDQDWYKQRALDLAKSTGGTLDHDVHRKRRDALNPFLSLKGVLQLEQMIRSKVQQLCHLLDEASKSPNGDPTNLYDLYYALARDVVYQYSFGKESNLLGDPVEVAELREHLTRLLFTVKLAGQIPWIFKAMKSLPSAIGKFLAPPGAIDMARFGQNIGKEINHVLKGDDPKHETGTRSIFYELRDNPDMPASEKGFQRFLEEGTLLVMAGTESTAKSLGITTFHLINKPETLHRLRAELQSVAEDAPLTELMRLPYLSACIAEGDRLSFGVTSRCVRIAPEEALQCGKYLIPAGTPMSMASLCSHTNQKVFPDPWNFVPERFMGEAGKEKRKYTQSFGKGARNCVGMNLAHAELFLAIAAVARYNLELFETDLSDIEFRHDFQVSFGKLDSKGIRVEVLGKHAQ